MSIFFRREFYSKAVSLLLALAFLAESTLAPILLFLPRAASAAATTYIASADFSSAQGQKNWQYLSSSGVQMTFDAANNRWKGSETYPPLLWGSGGHPGSTRDAVRRWLAPQAGTTRITGNVRDGDTGGGDGVLVSIRKSGVTLWQQTIANGNTTGFNYDLTASVYAGETIDFVINKIGNDQYDSTVFDPTIVINAQTTGQPTLSVSPTSFAAGTPLALSLTNAAPNTAVKVFWQWPDGSIHTAPDGMTNSSGSFSTSYATADATSAWGPGNYRAWVTVNGVQSNTVSWTVTAVPATQKTPVGSLDGIDANGAASGWAVDPDSSSTPISVHFYIDGAAGQGGTYAGSAVANLSRTGIGYSGNHGFSFAIPPKWRDGKSHTLYVHGIDLSGDGSKNVLLSNVPKSFTFGTAQTQSIVISRTPATSQTNPYKVGDATVSIVNASPSFFTTNLTGTGYNQIGSNTPRTFSFSTLDLVNSGACNAQTGVCNLPGNWDAASFACPAGVTGVQQMTEWYTVGNTTSNKIQWYFECSGGSTVNNPVDSVISGGVLPVGATAVYKGDAKVWVASRINADTILFERWNDPLSSTNTVWRSKSQDGTFASESPSEIHYQPVTFYDHGVPADVFGQSDDPYDIWLTPTGLYTARSGQQKTLVAARIGYSTLPAFYSRQWCGLNTICNKASAEDQWDGWPLFGFMLQKENGTDIASIFTSPFGAGFENIQATLVDNGISKELRGQSYKTCSAWATTLGLCQNGSLYKAGADEVLRVKLDEQNLQWWYDGDSDGLVGCDEFGKAGVQYPRDAVVPHAVAIRITDRNSPTRLESTWAASREGACIASDTGTVSPPSRPAPTPTTAPMATMTLERDQEQVQPNQTVSFSGALNASQVAFPQGSSLVMAISEGVAVDRIEIDGRALTSSEFSVNGGNIKIPFSAALYNGSHTFRIVVRNTLPVQLDRRVSIWVTAVDAGNALLLKGRTASTMIAHLPTEVVGKGISVVTGPGYYQKDGSSFRSLQNAQDIDITRGPFWTPTSIPSLPDTIALTLFPGDASMQRVAFSLKQFSDPIAREFITAQYQYLLGRDPSSGELSRYLPLFTQWRNPLSALMEVYNRRADVREYVRVPGNLVVGKKDLPNYDKLIEWATMQGWKEESSLQSFKMQTGFDNGWGAFDELWQKWATAGGYYLIPWLPDNNNLWEKRIDPIATPTRLLGFEGDSFKFIHGLCGGSGPSDVFISEETRLQMTKPDFAACWANPYRRHQMILWAKDTGWAYNKVVAVSEVFNSGIGSYDSQIKSIVAINSAGPVLASMFGPGRYSEYAQEQQLRYPPAQLYYDLISSSEYASFSEQRFRKNIDSIFRLFFSRPANESDIAWTKGQFIGGGLNRNLGYDPLKWSWINSQWEPNGLLIASDFNYIDETEFLKNPRYINDYFYGIRHIPGEIDAVSSRLLEVVEKNKYQRVELYQGDNFKRIVLGLYRLYLRRNPTDAELEKHRASGKDFGDIEFELNQSAEYGKTSASDEAIRSLYRNYLGRDPSEADVTQWGDKTISSIANKIGTSADMKAIAQAHPENAYIFPIKKIKIQKCGFFCSVLGKIVGIAIVVVASYFGVTPLALVGVPGGVGAAIGAAVVSSIDASFNVSWRMISSMSKSFNEAGFNGETFVQYASIARAMAGQAGGVFSVTNVMENADPTILAGFRTMAVAPETWQDDVFRWLATPLGALGELFGIKQTVSSDRRLAQIDVFGHYGGGSVGADTLHSVPQSVSVSNSFFTEDLSQGSKGQEVLQLQKTLGKSDAAFLPEYQTGYYGPKTAEAVRRFQQRNGIAQVGVVGPQTRAALNAPGTASAATTLFTRTLAQGSRGPDVLKLQKILGGADLTFLPEYQTGYYGPKTEAAVKRFQKRYGLEQVGFVGPQTMALLDTR